MRVVLFALLLLAGGSAPAQESAAAEAQEPRRPFILKTTPLNLVNPIHQTLDLHADIPLAAHWSLDLGAAWVFGSDVYARFKEERFSGIKLRPALKYYFRPAGSGNAYLALALKYNLIRNDRLAQVTRQGGQYAEWITLDRQFDIWGAAIRWGQFGYLGPKKRWTIEPFIGVGVRVIRVSQDNLPADGELLGFQNEGFMDRGAGREAEGDFMLGFHIGWIPRK